MIIMGDFNIQKIVKDIYENIFCYINQEYIIVFLCGGISTKIKKSLRDKIRILIEGEKIKFYGSLPIKIFYPEDLLMDLLNKNKKDDLLSYEQFLADNSNIIVIICESPGALVELGAFTNNKYTVNKVIAAVDKKYIKDKSFIMLGPIKFLKKISKLNFISYSSDEIDFAKHLMKNIKEKHSKNYVDNGVKLNTIIGLYYFIQFLLYYFKELDFKRLITMISFLITEENIKLKDLNIMINTSLKLLFTDKRIFKTTNLQNPAYRLTIEGFYSIEKIISNCTSSKICDRIRLRVMYNSYYK